MPPTLSPSPGAARWSWRPLLPALILLCLTACGGGGSVRVEPAVTEMDARTAWLDGNFRGAAQLYQQLARQGGPERDRYALLAAEALREEGDLMALANQLGSIRRARLSPDDEARLDLLYAELALADGDADAAMALLAMPSEVGSVSVRVRALELRARALTLRGDQVASAAERLRLEPLLQGEERARNRAEAEEGIAGLDDDQLRNLLRDTPRDEPLYELLARLSQERFGGDRRGSYARAVQAGPLATNERVRTYRTDQLPREAGSQVALLLPQRGALAAPAAALQEGVMAAYFADQGARPLLRIYDAGNSREEALAAYDQAVAEGADHILGPLSREAVTGLFERQQALLPTLALNYADAAVIAPRGSLQFALLPEEEAAAIAVRLAERRHGRVLVLRSADELGQRSLAAFRAAHEARGGRIIDSASADPRTPDQSAALAKLAGNDSGRDRVRYLRGLLGLDLRYEPAPRSDVDAIVLLVRAPQARLLLPQLRTRQDLPGEVYATSAVYEGRPNPALDRDLDGLQFCDSPWLLGGYVPGDVPERSALAGLPTTDGPAARLFAYGIDAWRLLPLLDWLEANPGQAVDGATGKLSADRNGRIRRLLTWARFENGVPVVVD
ncbi:MAG: penicillin-binding protein activator [Xanthomonadales bacterium]|nr:penicillin-binding protein activator [Xanthomonadales bacterium]